MKKHGMQSDARIVNGIAHIDAARNFVYDGTGQRTNEWRPQRVVVGDIVRVWYVLEPFTNFAGIAHPYIIFETKNSEPIAFSIEGKRLHNEPYSGIKGMLNAYELGYVWMSVNDCLSMPLSVGCVALYLFELTLTPEESQKLFIALVEGTHALYQRPQFYNTVFANCTTVLCPILNKVRPGSAPWDISWHLPGYSDEYLIRRGLMVPKARSQVDLKPHAKEILAHATDAPKEFLEIIKRWAIQDSNL